MYDFMKNTKRFYAIVTIEKFCVYGTGGSPEQAFENSKKWLPEKGGAAYVEFQTDVEGRLNVKDQDRHGKATRTESGR
jgi:hypothetical protein